MCSEKRFRTFGGFVRIITAYATAYYICDVIIDEAHGGKGFGKKLINAIVNDEQLNLLFGILATNHLFVCDDSIVLEKAAALQKVHYDAEFTLSSHRTSGLVLCL